MTTPLITPVGADPYRAGKAPALVDVPPQQFLMIDGRGDPNTAPEYAAALEALYALAYGLKFALKKRDPALDFKVSPLEGLWWAEDLGSFREGDRSRWQWTMLIAVPDTVTEADLAQVAAAAERKGKAAAHQVRLERYAEGRCAQILHTGPYRDEAPTIQRLHAFIAAQGCRPGGKHHEIYLGDPRRTAPERLRTIIRQPIA